MSNTSGKFMKQPQPRVEIGQFWKDRNGTVRRVVEPLDEWEVHFARVVDGYRSRVQRVSRWGAPSAGYTFVPKEPDQMDPVHIRRSAGRSERRTFCGRIAQGLITTTINNLGYWRKKKREICGVCEKRAGDGVHAELDRTEAA